MSVFCDLVKREVACYILGVARPGIQLGGEGVRDFWQGVEGDEPGFLYGLGTECDLSLGPDGATGFKMELLNPESNGVGQLGNASTLHGQVCRNNIEGWYLWV